MKTRSEDELMNADSESAPARSAAPSEGGNSEGVDQNVRSISLLKVTLLVTSVVGAVVLLYAGRAVLAPLLLAWVISMALKPTVGWLGHKRVPTQLAAALVLGMVVLTSILAAYYLVQPTLEWMKQAPENLPKLRQKFDHILKPAARLTAAASSMGELETTKTSPGLTQKVEIRDHRVADFLFSSTGSLLAFLAETFALVFLLLASGDSFTQKVVRLMPTFHDKKHAVEIVRSVQSQIANYLFAALLINSGFGLVLGICVYALGLPNAIMWGGLAALLNFIPYFGPIIGTLTVAVAGLLAFDSLGQGLLPAGAYLVAHLVEANLVTPFFLGRSFTLNPVVIFVALMAGTALWGVVGAVLAVPLLVCIKALCDQIKPLNEIGHILSS